jgi:hypothetical protein
VWDWRSIYHAREIRNTGNTLSLKMKDRDQLEGITVDGKTIKTDL